MTIQYHIFNIYFLSVYTFIILKWKNKTKRKRKKEYKKKKKNFESPIMYSNLFL